MTRPSSYRTGAALGIGTTLFLVWGVLALGVLASEGDRADLMYLGVIAVGLVGALISRGKPEGLSKTSIAMAAAQAVVTGIALLIGKHNDPATSVLEIVALNTMFIGLFLGSGWFFRRAETDRGLAPPS